MSSHPKFLVPVHLGSIRSLSRSIGIRTGELEPMFIKNSLLLGGLSAAFAASAIAQEEKPKPQILFTNVNVFDGKIYKNTL